MERGTSGTGEPDPARDEPARPTDAGGRRRPTSRARELTRRRERASRAPDTGRVHHLGAAPAGQPVHTDGGLSWVETSQVRLRTLTDAQLSALAAELEERMRAAAARLEFEEAARLLAEHRRVRGCVLERGISDPPPNPPADPPTPPDDRAG
jgi:hypothetical protein